MTNLLFSITLFIYLSSGTSQISKNNISSLNNEQEKEIKIDGLTEAEAYKLLYENQIDANDDILKTIFYALGGLGTAVLLVFGSNWYFNHQKVKEAMTEIDTKVNSLKAALQTDILERLNIIKTEFSADSSQNQALLISNYTLQKENLRSELKSDIQLSLDGFQELIQSYNSNTNQQLISIKEIIDEKVKNLNVQIELSERRVDSKHSQQAVFIKRDILRQKADVATLKGNLNLSLKAHLDFAMYDFKEDMSTLFKYTSKGVIECLEKVTYLYEDEKDLLTDLIELAKEEFPEITTSLIELSKDKEVRVLNK